MFYAKIADLIIRFDNKYDYLEKMCADYVCGAAEPNLILEVTDKEIAAECGENEAFPAYYLETLAVYRKLSNILSEKDGLLMHGVVIDVDGEGIAFLAKSGTGKSTHMFLWKKLLGDKCIVVNGDKPLIRFTESGIPYAFGTPWAGKEHIQTNKKIPLKKICFIERSKNNSVEKIDKKNATARLFPQIYMPPDGSCRSEIFDKLDKLVRYADFYIIKCNTDLSAAQTAYNTVLKNKDIL